METNSPRWLLRTAPFFCRTNRGRRASRVSGGRSSTTTYSPADAGGSLLITRRAAAQPIATKRTRPESEEPAGASPRTDRFTERTRLWGFESARQGPGVAKRILVGPLLRQPKLPNEVSRAVATGAAPPGAMCTLWKNSVKAGLLRVQHRERLEPTGRRLLMAVCRSVEWITKQTPPLCSFAHRRTTRRNLVGARSPARAPGLDRRCRWCAAGAPRRAGAIERQATYDGAGRPGVSPRNSSPSWIGTSAK